MMAIEWQLITKTLIFSIDVIGIGLIFLVYFSNPRAKLNRIFVAMMFLMFIWVNFAFLARLAGQTEQALLYIRMAWAITPFFFVLIYFFVIYFIQTGEKYKLFNILNLFLGTILFFITLFTNLIIKGIEFEDTALRIIYGRWVYLFFGAIFFLTILSFVLLLKRYFKSPVKKERVKIQYVLIGLFLFFLMNSIFNIFLPVFLRIIHLYEFGDYSTIIFLGFIAYAIVKRELFGIRVILATALVSLIALLLALDVFIFTPQLLFKLYKGLILVIFLYFGYLLVRSVLREIRYRERIKKAYDVEKEARKKIQELGEAKTQFIMATQHHLRTPLTSMRGYIDLILTGSYGKISPTVKQAVLKLQVSTKRLVRIVNELLDVSQFQLGKKVVSLQPGIQIKPILEEVIEELKFTAETKGIYLKFQKPEGKLPSIKADVEKLKVALFNLVDNGIKYTNKGGVTVKLQVVNGKLQVVTKDTGMGVPKEKLKTLFSEVFRRGKQAKKVFATGRGIGLYVTNKIIQAHQGRVWAESEGEGRGSTFYVELPIEKMIK